MKKFIIGLILAISLTMGAAVYGAAKYPSSDSMPGTSVEKVFASQSMPFAISTDEQHSQDAAFFSWPAIFYFYTILIVTSATRRNTKV